MLTTRAPEIAQSGTRIPAALAPTKALPNAARNRLPFSATGATDLCRFSEHAVGTTAA